MKFKLYTALIWIVGSISVIVLGFIAMAILLIGAVFKCLSAILGASYEPRKVPHHPRYWSRRRN